MCTTICYEHMQFDDSRASDSVSDTRLSACLTGAMDAEAPVGGIRILREAGTTILSASYLSEGSAVFCRFLAPRKVTA